MGRPRIRAPGRVDVRGRVVVPIVTTVGDGADRGLDRLATTNIVQRSPDRLGNEPAPETGLDPNLEIANKLVVQRNVHTHGHRIAH